MQKNKIPLTNKEISWLYFNARVLQEAEDKSVPLIGRLRFLAIFYSNLDEFYRLTVATLNRLAVVNTKAKELFGYNPKKLLKEIKTIVVQQEERFNHLFEKEIVPQLAQEKIFILNNEQLNVTRGQYVRNYFREKVLPTLVPIMLETQKPFPMLKDRGIYLLVKLKTKSNRTKYSLIEIPSDLGRFLILPETNHLRYIILIDDIIRYCLDDIYFIFRYNEIQAFSIQVTRDAEFDLDYVVSDKFIDALTKSLQKRKKGKPMRLLYDSEMPEDMLNYLNSQLDLDSETLIPGNRYQNFKDFIDFPNIGHSRLEYRSTPPLRVPGFDLSKSIFSQIAKKDYLVSLPYQRFDYIIHFLREAAIDPQVTEIHITLYRLAENSRIINALINASKNGKHVNCVLELKARFDEQANIYWTNRMEEEGVNVNYGIPDYKVHSKICLISRKEKGKTVYYANLATGNFNEKTARTYCDHSLFTTHPGITKELKRLFHGLDKKVFVKGFDYLVVSPLEGRKKINKLIDKEIENAKAGKVAYLILKMNSLTDERLIRKLYAANNAGVGVRLIIRGMCCLQAGVEGFSENIEVVSIVDKFLEHARVWIFGNGGDEKIYLSSADFMPRNLDKRVEVGFPVLDPDIRQEIKDIIDIQLSNNTKARSLKETEINRYRKTSSKENHRAQYEIYNYLKNKTIEIRSN